ncbi:hypothetical protein Tco_0668946 [Tanacetum coccineum]
MIKMINLFVGEYKSKGQSTAKSKGQSTAKSKGAGMLTRAMAKELSAASAHECLFIDFLSEEEPKKVFEALQHPDRLMPMQASAREQTNFPETKSGH